MAHSRSKQHAIENLNFWEAIHGYQALCCLQNTVLLGEKDDQELTATTAATDAARDIINRFVKEGAPEQVRTRCGIVLYSERGCCKSD